VSENPVLVTQAQYARMRGVTPPAISHRVKSGEIKVHGERKLIDVAEADSIIAANTSQARIDTGQAKVAMATGKAEKSVEGMSFHESRVMKMREDALRSQIARESEEISLAIKRGSVIPAEHVAAAWGSAVTMMRTRLFSCPSSAAPRITSKMITAEIETVIRDEIDEALEAITNAVVVQSSDEPSTGSDDDSDAGASKIVTKKATQSVGRRKPKAKQRRIG